jgi:predicted PilT family ATPase
MGPYCLRTAISYAVGIAKFPAMDRAGEYTHVARACLDLYEREEKLRKQIADLADHIDEAGNPTSGKVISDRLREILKS